MDKVFLFLAVFMLSLGIIASFFGSIIFLIRSFSVSIGWGLACMFVPFASLVFLVKYWDEAMEPFLLSLVGGILTGVGSFLIPMLGGNLNFM